MTPVSHNLSPRQFALSIVRTLRDAGHLAYFAGGCVRDELMGLVPKDFDVATDAAPERIAALFPRTEEVGARFGVMIIKARGQMTEVATFRADGPYSDRRRPDAVTFSDPQTDAARRDFTINALFLDPLAPPDPITLSHPPQGKIIDFVNGLADIRAKILRAVGDPDARFKEDDLRVLRAIRFAARFNLVIDPATSAAIRRHAGELSGISRERVGEETRKMLLHDSRALAATLLASHGLVAPTLGGTSDLPNHSRQDFPILSAITSPKLGVLLAAWISDLGLSVHARDMLQPRPKPDNSPQTHIAIQLRKALALSNEETQEFLGAVEGAAALVEFWPTLRVAPAKRWSQTQWFLDALALLQAKESQIATQIAADLALLAATPGGLNPEPFINGDDLHSLGLVPGPRFKSVLAQMYDAQLEARIQTRVEALELVRRLCV